MRSSERIRRNRVILERLMKYPALADANYICTYVALPDEVDTKPLIGELFKKKKSVVVPKVIGRDLELQQITSLSDVGPGTFGILEPKPACPFVDPTLVDVFIVPGVMFDRKGNRRGRGKGYYDRLLKGAKALKIGLAYSFQIVPRLPRKQYDIPMDIVITEYETLTP